MSQDHAAASVQTHNSPADSRRSVMAGKRKAEDEPEVSDDDDDDEEISEEEAKAILAESRARALQEYSEMFARLGLREDVGLSYDDEE
jgi:hypothetical protein